MRNSAVSFPRAATLDADASVEWTLADLIHVLLRRRAWILASLALCSAAALLSWIAATPLCRATAIIEVQKQSRGAFGLDNTTADTPTTALSDSFDDNLTLQTEIGILQSDAVALDVIRRAGLESTPDYFAPRHSRFPRVASLSHHVFFWQKSLEPLSIPLEDAPNRRYVALQIFAKRAKIAPAAGTRLIRISYSDPDPQRAAAVVNALVQSLGETTFHSRSSAAAQSAAWLEAQLTGLRQQTDALDARAAALDRTSGSFGDNDAHNVILARLDELNASLAAAQSNRIVREAVWRAVQSGDPEVISGLSGAPGAGTNTQNSFALLQSLRAQESAAKSQLAESAGRYGENWPALAEQRTGLATIQKSIQDEIQRLGERAKSDYDVAVQAENSARAAFNQQQALASQITGSAVDLRLARQQADASRNLYTSLQQRLQQAGVLEGLHSGNFVVVAPALVPSPDHPASPSAPLLAALALAAGLALGCTAALIRELTDNTLHSFADLEPLLDAPLLAALPPPEPARPWLRRLLPDRKGDLTLQAAAASDFAIPAPDSPFVEALHRLRAHLLSAPSGEAPRVITLLNVAGRTFAADQPHGPYNEEPHPTLALNLAAVLAQHGASTLYVDADLRYAPAAGDYPVGPGLADLLAGDVDPAFLDPDSMPPLLSVLHTGARPACPAERIASPRMKTLLERWRQQFTFVVIDGPTAAYSDALHLAHLSDAVLLAARANETRRDETRHAFHSLSRSLPDHTSLGLILENAPEGAAYAHA